MSDYIVNASRTLFDHPWVRICHDTLDHHGKRLDYFYLASPVVVAHPAVPARSVKELVALAKARPGQMNYASNGVGTIPHLAIEVLMREARINLVRIGEFAWTPMEPAEGRFDLGWLHRIVEKMAAAGIEVMLCTPTATPPSWSTSMCRPVDSKATCSRTRMPLRGARHRRKSCAPWCGASGSTPTRWHRRAPRRG